MAIEDVERRMKAGEDWIAVSVADLTEIFQRLNYYGEVIKKLDRSLVETERARDAFESKLSAAENLIGSLRDELVSLRSRKRPLDTVATPEYVTREMFDRLGQFTHRLCSRIEKLEAAQQQHFDAAVRTNP